MLRILFGTQVHLAICLLAAALVLSGCGLTINNPALSNGSPSTPTGTAANTAVPIQIHVGGTEWSVSGASIQMYAAGTQGMGSSATPLLTQPVATDSSGDITITEAYACPSPTSQVYLVASGGNPGLASGTNNQALRLLTVLGSCNQLSSSTIYPVNEVTTVGSIWPLSAYMGSATQLGSSPADTSFATALTKIGQLVNLVKGVSPGTGIQAGYAVQSAKLDTLASDLHACVSSSGGTAGDGSPCGQLFSLTTAPGGAAPTDTIEAALHLAQANQLSVEGLFQFAPANAAFQPVLPEAPTDWDLNLILIPAAPVFAPSGGTYANGQQITLSSTSGATLHYTVDGSTPSLSSSVYSGPLVLSSAETVRAIAITDEINSPVSSATFSLSPLHLAFGTQPSNVVTNALFNVAVSIVDNAGNVSQVSAPITLKLNGAGTLSGAATSNAANGVALFPNLSIPSAGSGYTLTATSEGVASATSIAFNVTSPAVPAVPTIAVALPGSSINIGSTLSGSLTLNTAAGSGGVAVQLSSTAPSIVAVTQSIVTIPAGGSTGSFSYRGIAAGTAAISAAAAGYVTATAQISSVLPQPTLNNATSATVVITSSQVGTVSPMAVGMKFDRSQFGEPTQLFTSTNAGAVNNFKALSPLQGESCLLSLGVNDAKPVKWVPDGAGQTPGQVSEADIDALAEFLKAANCQLDYSAPVLNNTPENAADEVSYVEEKVGSNLLAVGFGNEPDAVRYNTTASGFAATWNAFAKAALARNNNLHFEGPDVGTATDLGPWVSAWYKENSSLPLVYAGQHYYVYGPGGCPACTEALMLENRSAELYWNTMVSQKESFEASLEKPLPLVLTETNNFYDGGAPGVSDSYGSALYAYDFLFQASQAGFRTSAFTTLENSSKGYSPLYLSNGLSYGPLPEYYGIYMGALAGYGPMLSTVVQNADGLHAYTINNVGSSTMNVALINTTGTNFTVNAMLPAGTSPKTCSDYVMSDSAGLTDTVAVHLNIQGGHFDEDSHIAVGAPYSVPLQGATATIAVPSYSGVLVNCTY